MPLQETNGEILINGACQLRVFQSQSVRQTDRQVGRQAGFLGESRKLRAWTGWSCFPYTNTTKGIRLLRSLDRSGTALELSCSGQARSSQCLDSPNVWRWGCVHTTGPVQDHNKGYFPPSHRSRVSSFHRFPGVALGRAARPMIATQVPVVVKCVRGCGFYVLHWFLASPARIWSHPLPIRYAPRRANRKAFNISHSDLRSFVFRQARFP